AECLAKTQDVTAVIDGGRLRRSVTLGRQVECSPVRTPGEQVPSVGSGGVVVPDDERGRVYSDCIAGQTQDHRCAAVLEYRRPRFAICGRTAGGFARVVYRVDEPGQILRRAVAQNVASLAPIREPAGQNAPHEPERAVANDRAAGIDTQCRGVGSRHGQPGIGARGPKPSPQAVARGAVVSDDLSPVVDPDCGAAAIGRVCQRQDRETTAIMYEPTRG